MRQNSRIFYRLLFSLSIIASILIFTPGHAQKPDADEQPAFSETFQLDILENGWEKQVLIGNPDQDIHSVGRNRLSIKLPGGDTAVLFTNAQTRTDDSYVEAVFENILTAEASYGLICRSNEEGWYEFRIYVSGPRAGAYTFLRYETGRKTKFQTPYVTVHAGMDQIFTHDIKLGLNVKNKLGLSCQGDQFRLYINDNEQRQFKKGEFSDNFFTEGSDGVMFNTYGNNIAQFDLSEFSVYGNDLQPSASSFVEVPAQPVQEEAIIPLIQELIQPTLSAPIEELPQVVEHTPVNPEFQPAETASATSTSETSNSEDSEDSVIYFFSSSQQSSSDKTAETREDPDDSNILPPVSIIEEIPVETAPETGSISEPPEVPPPVPVPVAIEPEIISEARLGQVIPCGNAFQFSFFWQPKMVRSLSGEKTQARFLYFRAQITNLTGETIITLPARSFKALSVINGVSQEYRLNTGVSLLTSDSWDVGLITDSLEPGKTLDTFLVFEVPGHADEWYLDFQPILKLSDGPLCAIRMKFPKIDYQD